MIINKPFYQISEIPNTIFGSNVKLLPSVDELFELELANLEYHILDKDELIERSAFFQSANGNLTKYFRLYSVHATALSENRSAQTNNYFENGQFSTGYATHGLFPYLGKFHPQLIKGLINI
jgi:histone deacetylase complex regulatory component SIN3